MAEELREEPGLVREVMLLQVRGEPERDRLRAQRLRFVERELGLLADDRGVQRCWSACPASSGPRGATASNFAVSRSAGTSNR